MQDVADWLRKLGLEQYAARFSENGIDVATLPDLTDQDLASLGVLLGHRRRILRAIRETQPTTDPTVPSTPQDQGERRQLTVMFCDLVGSTALAARLDPEDMRAVIRAYQDCCAGAVARYDGFIAQFMGDGVLVYFGYPLAHEDDAERAVRAGQDIRAAVQRLNTPAGTTLRVHIGIATGIVVVGDLIGQGAAQERAVVGETPNLAARLQACAQPGEIVVSAATRRLLGDVFPLRALGAITLKGISMPAEAWVVEGSSLPRSRFEAARMGSLTSFVGREREVAHLNERRDRAWRGQGQIVMISGEAGIGKSRFIAEFTERIRDTDQVRLRYQCSPYHSASTLHPIIEHLQRAAGIDPAEPDHAALDRLEALLRETASDRDDAVPLYAALLGIPTAPRYDPLGYSPARQRRQTLAALLDQLESLARRQPVLMLFEDIHWADATTLELLNLMIERVRVLPVLALITHRVDFEPPWIGLDNVSAVTLDRLGRAHVQVMIDWLTAGRPLPDEVVTQIFTKTDGVPLFVEELTKAVLESRLVVEDAGTYRLDGKLPPLAIPPTLQDSLMARLDRLAPVREIAQVGAAIGREFSYDLLAAVAGRDPGVLNEALDRLESSELLFRIGAPPQTRYRFKHALVRDAAYESMLRSRRQILHRAIAETLRDRFPVVAAAEPEVIAHHFTQAGLGELAVHWWTTAGEQAARRSAYVEAISHFREAIPLAEKLPEAEFQRPRLIRLYLAYGDALHNRASPGARETREAYARARVLASDIPQGTERYPIYHGLWSASVIRADVTSMHDLAATFERDVDRDPHSPEAGLGHRFIGVYNWMSGNPTRGVEHLEAAVGAFERSPEHNYGFQLDLHQGVAAMSQLAWAYWLLGRCTKAQAIAEKGLALASASNHLPTTAYAYTWTCKLDALRADAEGTLVKAAALVRLGRDHELPFWQANGEFFHDWARWRRGDRDIDIVGMRKVVDLMMEQGLAWYSILLRLLITAPQATMQDPATALATIDGAIRDIETTGLGWPLAEALRERADVLAAADPASAERDYTRAIAVATAQHADGLALRAALGLARLFLRRGYTADAMGVITTAMQACSPDADVPEREQARLMAETLTASV